MSQSTTVRCPKCGKDAQGRFCAHCGQTLGKAAGCGACGRPLADGAKFCHHCGASAVASVGAAKKVAWVWLVPGVAVLAVVAFLIGQRISTSGRQAAAESGGTMSAPFAGGAGGAAGAAGARAPDISSLSPEERANRLFDRIMRYGEEGKVDSARIFAPMAVQAYEMIGPLDNHSRYDVGIIAVVTGDAALAKAQGDTILKSSPTHLLGLILAMKAAGLAQKTAERDAFEKRLLAAAAAEKTKGLKEYTDHMPDIDAALKAAGNK